MSMTWCRGRMAGFKAPRSVEFVDRRGDRGRGVDDQTGRGGHRGRHGLRALPRQHPGADRRGPAAGRTAGLGLGKQVGEATGAGTVCGRCRGSIRALIAAARQQAAPLG
ncbi:hypothetical protein [Mycolicibacterium hippocampi]|uniref:(2Fe-2S)-binding protein n=1 Tax=Mycolicibacterium hippocampi TaxID=659824 RepID=UPI003F49AEA3